MTGHGLDQPERPACDGAVHGLRSRGAWSGHGFESHQPALRIVDQIGVRGHTRFRGGTADDRRNLIGDREVRPVQ